MRELCLQLDNVCFNVASGKKMQENYSKCVKHERSTNTLDPDDIKIIQVLQQFGKMHHL